MFSGCSQGYNSETETDNSHRGISEGSNDTQNEQNSLESSASMESDMESDIDIAFEKEQADAQKLLASFKDTFNDSETINLIMSESSHFGECTFTWDYSKHGTDSNYTFRVTNIQCTKADYSKLTSENVVRFINNKLSTIEIEGVVKYRIPTLSVFQGNKLIKRSITDNTELLRVLMSLFVKEDETVDYDSAKGEITRGAYEALSSFATKAIEPYQSGVARLDGLEIDRTKKQVTSKKYFKDDPYEYTISKENDVWTYEWNVTEFQGSITYEMR